MQCVLFFRLAGDFGGSASAESCGGPADLHFGWSAQQWHFTGVGPHGVPVTPTHPRPNCASEKCWTKLRG